VFRLWQGINSGYWDDQAFDVLGQAAIIHSIPRKSDPSIVDKIPRDWRNSSAEEIDNYGRKARLRGHKARLLEAQGKIVYDDHNLNFFADPKLMAPKETPGNPDWPGIRKDIGMFTEKEFEFLMSKVLRSLSKSDLQELLFYA